MYAVTMATVMFRMRVAGRRRRVAPLSAADLFPKANGHVFLDYGRKRRPSMTPCWLVVVRDGFDPPCNDFGKRRAYV